jgi:hypothetical protein
MQKWRFNGRGVSSDDIETKARDYGVLKKNLLDLVPFITGV